MSLIKAYLNSNFLGNSEIKTIILSKQWAESDLGDSENWSPLLLSALQQMLFAKQASAIIWGEKNHLFFNQAFSLLFNIEVHTQGDKLTKALQQLLLKGFEDFKNNGVNEIFHNEKTISLNNNFYAVVYNPLVFNQITEGLVLNFKKNIEDNNDKKIDDKAFIRLMEGGPIAYSIFYSADFVIEMANEEALKLWRKDNSVIGKKLIDALPELIGQPYLKIIEDVYNTGITYEGKESLAYLQQNELLVPVYVNFTYKAVRNEQGIIDRILCIGYDVTEQVNYRKKISETEERARLAIESANLGTFDINFITNETISSNRFKEIFGFAENDKTIEDIIKAIHPDDAHVKNNASEAVQKNGFFNYDLRIIHSNKTTHYINAQARVFNDANNIPTRLIGIVEDITNTIFHEKELRASEEKFRNTVKQAPVGIAILKGSDFIFEMANETYLQLIDKSERETIGKKLFDCLPEVEIVVKPLLQDVLKLGKEYNARELKIQLTRFGKTETAYFNLVYQPLKEEDGTISGIMVVANEVTDQINARYQLIESEKQFRNVVMHSPIGITILRGNDLIIEMANNAMLDKLWRKKENEVIGKSILEAFPELKDQQFPKLLRNVIKTKVAHRENEAIAFVEGNDGMKKFYLDFEYAPLFDTDQNVSGLMITVIDVTQKVELRQQIEESADRLIMATEGTKMATWDLDLRTREIFHSPQLAEIFGHEKNTKLSHLEMRNQIHVTDAKHIVEIAFDKALQTGLYNYEARVIHPDKTVHWIRVAGKVYYDNTNKPLRMLGTMMDITAQKVQEEKLARLAAIVQSTSDAIIAINLNRIITSWNDSAERIFGYTEKEILGSSITRLIPKELLHQEDDFFAKIKDGNHVEHLQTKRLHKTGYLIDVSLSISPIKDASGKVVSVSKIARDISKQKNIERLISDNEERLKIIVEASELGTWNLDLITNKLEYSERFLQFFGFSKDAKLSHLTVRERIHADDLIIREKALEEALQTGILNYITRIVWADGSIHWIEAKGKVLFDDQKKQ